MSGRTTSIGYFGGYDSNTRVIDPNNGKSVREVFGGGKGQAKAAPPSKGGLFASLGRFGKKQQGEVVDDTPSYTYDACSMGTVRTVVLPPSMLQVHCPSTLPVTPACGQRT